MNAAAGLGIFFGGLLLYLLPSIVAAIRKVPNTGSVVIIDLLLGWTFIGWAIALAMACRSVPYDGRHASEPVRGYR